MHYKPKNEIRQYSIYNHQNVFVSNRKMIVLVGESGKWEARCKGRIRVKDTASYNPLKQWRYQHTLQTLQPLNAQVAHFDTIVSKFIIIAALLFLLMNIITSNRKKRVDKFFTGARTMIWSRINTENPQELGATGKEYNLSLFTRYRWSTVICC